MKVLILWADCM